MNDATNVSRGSEAYLHLPGEEVAAAPSISSENFGFGSSTRLFLPPSPSDFTQTSLHKSAKMPLFRKSSVSSDASSSKSETSSTTTSSLFSNKSDKVKAGELGFATTASPNSRFVFMGPDDAANGAPVARSASTGGSSLGGGSRRGSVQKDDDAGNAPARKSPAAAASQSNGKRSSKPEPLSDSSESESESSEEEAPRAKGGKKSSASQASSKSGSPAKKAAAAVGGAAAAGAAVVKGKKGKASHASDLDSEDDLSPSMSESDSDSSIIEETELSEEDEPLSDEEELAKGKSGKKKMSRAARLAAEAMESPANARRKKGKPLSKLTYDDVKLTENDVKEDLKVVWKAMHLFMNSRMIEAEEICLSAADHRLYYSVGYSLIQCIKSLMTFEPEDLDAAIQCCKDSIIITQLLRKKDHGMMENVGRLAKGSTSVGSIKGMTLVQRHAELIYAECTLLKAVIGIIYSGDFIAFLKEALNMRNAYSIYRTLAKYVEVADKEYGGEDPAVDQDFRSGVYLGNGLISLILSLLPSAVLKIMTVFGFTGDREYGLRTLMKAGKWTAGKEQPELDVAQEGIRRQVCDMALLFHHLVISNYLPVGGVDVPTAGNILRFNLDRYPNGVFFLYFSGRLHSTETQLESAVKAFHLAIQAQREYVQLGHICYWDLGLVSLASGNYNKGYECFNILDKESNWSKAIYAYAKAVSIYEQGKDKRKANEIMASVPDLMQRIAGKSIPLEKFVARRAKKYVQQGGRLCLPGIELAYVLNCLGLSPRFILFDVHLDQVSQQLADLHQVKDPSSYGKTGEEFWDDYCLAHLLRGIILRFIAFPEAHTVPRPAKSPIPPKEAAEQALISFNNVLKHGKDIIHDHHLVWFAHYELGRLYDARKEYGKAKTEYDVVMSGKIPEVSTKKGKGKVSLQNMAILRSNSAINVMREDGKI